MLLKANIDDIIVNSFLYDNPLMDNKTPSRLTEIFFVLVIITILTSVLFFKYIKFVDYAIITEGQTSASNISKMLEVYYSENEQYKQIEDIDYDPYLGVDIRNNTYFKTFSIIVPGTYKNSLYSIKLSTKKGIEDIDIILHMLKYQQKLFEIKKGNKTEYC